MNDGDLRLNTYIRQDENVADFRFKCGGMTAEERADLEKQPIASNRSIVCSVTTYCRGKPPGFKN